MLVPKTVFWSRIWSKTFKKKKSSKKMCWVIFSYKNWTFGIWEHIVRYQRTLMLPIFFPFWTAYLPWTETLLYPLYICVFTRPLYIWFLMTIRHVTCLGSWHHLSQMSLLLMIWRQVAMSFYCWYNSNTHNETFQQQCIVLSLVLKKLKRVWKKGPFLGFLWKLSRFA